MSGADISTVIPTHLPHDWRVTRQSAHHSRLDHVQEVLRHDARGRVQVRPRREIQAEAAEPQR